MNAKRKKSGVDESAFSGVFNSGERLKLKPMARKEKGIPQVNSTKKDTDLLLASANSKKSKAAPRPMIISRTASVIARIELASLKAKTDLESLVGCIAASEYAAARWNSVD